MYEISTTQKRTRCDFYKAISTVSVVVATCIVRISQDFLLRKPGRVPHKRASLNVAPPAAKQLPRLLSDISIHYRKVHSHNFMQTLAKQSATTPSVAIQFLLFVYGTLLSQDT